MRLFNPDSKLMVILTKVSDLLWLNVLTLLASIPVITIGAALTAKDYMCYKIVRNEENGITKGFFHSFKENFKQATAIWLMMLVVLAVGAFDMLFLIGLSGEGTENLRSIAVALYFFMFVAVIMIFPVLARFSDTVFGTIKKGVRMSVAIFPRAILMAVLYIAPIYIGLHWFAVIPLVFMFGISAPGYASALLYRKAFEKIEARYYEEHPEEAPEEDPVEEAMRKAAEKDRK